MNVKVLVAQSSHTLCDSMDCSPQAPLSMEFSRQEYWNGLPFPFPEDLPNPGIEPRSPALQVDSLLFEPKGGQAGCGPSLSELSHEPPNPRPCSATQKSRSVSSSRACATAACVTSAKSFPLCLSVSTPAQQEALAWSGGEQSGSREQAFLGPWPREGC